MDADENHKGKPRTGPNKRLNREYTRIKSPFIRVDSCAFAVVFMIVFICVKPRPGLIGQGQLRKPQDAQSGADFAP